MKLSAMIISAVIIFSSSVSAQDPGRPDTILIGCPDSLNCDPIYVGLGQQVVVPLWWKTDDSISFFHIPVAASDSFVAAREAGPIYYPFTLLDEIEILPPNSASPRIGYTSQSLLGLRQNYAGLNDPRSPLPYFLDYQWFHVCDFIMTTTSDASAFGDTTCLIEGNNPANGGLFFGLPDGQHGFRPTAIWGKLRFTDFIPGDVNASGYVNGLDVVYLVNYLKGLGPAPLILLLGDTNEDCQVNGLDVIYLVNYFRGIGPAPIRGLCP